MLKQSLDAMINLDVKRTHQVFIEETEVDILYHDNYEQIKNEIGRHPEQIEGLLLLLYVTDYMEQVADHAKKIAEDVIYTVTGEIVRHRTSDLKQPVWIL